MKNNTPRATSATAILLTSAVLGVLTGCVGYVESGPGYSRGYVVPPQVEVVVQDDYVYYPGYQVYYSSSRRQYIYLEGRTWVTRPAPPRVSVDVLFASPSVVLEFHDSPWTHHDTVIRQYPKSWRPSGPPPGRGQGNRNDNGPRGNGRGRN